MDKIKLRYKKDKKVFVPERDIDLPDDYEIEISEILTGEKTVQAKEIPWQSNIREDFIQYFLHKYPGKSIDDIDETLLSLPYKLRKYLGNQISEKILFNIFYINIPVNP